MTWSVDEWLYFSRARNPVVKDGDTISFSTIDLPFGATWSPQKCPGGKKFTTRVCGIDAYETSRRESQTTAEILAGLLTKSAVKRIIRGAYTGKTRSPVIYIRTYTQDVFGRWMADVYVPYDFGLVSIAKALTEVPGLCKTDERSEVASHRDPSGDITEMPYHIVFDKLDIRADLNTLTSRYFKHLLLRIPSRTIAEIDCVAEGLTSTGVLQGCQEIVGILEQTKAKYR